MISVGIVSLVSVLEKISSGIPETLLSFLIIDLDTICYWMFHRNEIISNCYERTIIIKNNTNKITRAIGINNPCQSLFSASWVFCMATLTPGQNIKNTSIAPMPHNICCQSGISPAIPSSSNENSYRLYDHFQQT